MPGYEVRGYTFSFDKEPHAVRNPRNTGPTGWRDGDVLHCRVRGVFDPRMMHVSVRRPGPEDPSLVRVRAEGCGGTRVKAVTLLSRRADGAETTRTPMRETALNGEYTAHLPQARPRVRSSTRSRRPPRTAACSAGRARRRRGCGRR